MHGHLLFPQPLPAYLIKVLSKLSPPRAHSLPAEGGAQEETSSRSHPASPGTDPEVTRALQAVGPLLGSAPNPHSTLEAPPNSTLQQACDSGRWPDRRLDRVVSKRQEEAPGKEREGGVLCSCRRKGNQLAAHMSPLVGPLWKNTLQVPFLQHWKDVLTWAVWSRRSRPAVQGTSAPRARVPRKSLVFTARGCLVAKNWNAML